MVEQKKRDIRAASTFLSRSDRIEMAQYFLYHLNSPPTLRELLEGMKEAKKYQ